MAARNFHLNAQDRNSMKVRSASFTHSLQVPIASNDVVADAKYEKYDNHPCITEIKRHMTGNEVFEFLSVSPVEVWEEINELDRSKKTSSEISTDIV